MSFEIHGNVLERMVKIHLKIFHLIEVTSDEGRRFHT